MHIPTPCIHEWTQPAGGPFTRNDHFGGAAADVRIRGARRARHLFTFVASAIVMTMLLAWKSELTREEIRGAVLLGLIGFVIYPLLPNRFIDAWHLLSPRQSWMIVIVIGALEFAN